MLDTNSLKPLYIQLEAEIRKALNEKKYLPGDRLPSEEELCEQYQVSRITVRKAIQQLTDQHILEKHRGKGTFVSTQPKSVDLKDQAGFTNYLSALGHQSHHLLLKKELQPAEEFLCDALSLQANEPVCYVQRLIFEDDSPLALDEIYVSSLNYPDFLDRMTGDVSFYELLDKYYHVSRGESVCEIAVRIANAEQASILHCQAGDPLFLMQKTCYAADGTPIHYSRSLVRGDRISYTIRTQSPGTQMTSNINS